MITHDAFIADWRADGASINLAGDYDITESKVIPSLAIIQQNILVKKCKSTTMPFYDMVS